MMASALDHYQQLFTKSQADLLKVDPKWLSELRQNSMLALQQQKFPTSKDQAWKYTPLTQLLASRPTLVTQQIENNALDLAWVHDFPRVVIRDGHFCRELSNCRGDFTVHSLKTVLQECPELVRNYLTDQQAIHAFDHLNKVFFQDGVVLQFGQNFSSDQPIVLLFIASQADKVNFTRNYIITEPGAAANVIEWYQGDAHEYWTSSMTYCAVAENASLHHMKVQLEAATSTHTSSLQVDLQQDSSFNSHVFSLSGQLLRHDLLVNLHKPGAHCQLQGLYLGLDKQHVAHHTKVNHLSVHTHSREYYKGIVADHAKAVFSGQVYIAEQAQQTSATQINKNLLLSTQAQVNTEPQLKIFADDVKCSHGATVGQLDANALFYLRSRGINEKTAKQLLLTGFVDEIIATLAKTQQNLMNPTLTHHLSLLGN